ncbi:MAG: hypothetical protein KGS72_24065, partial [Cyanobacteria bacterium REEB67]|nr:hypothetical protein [Cyanobacteria bacterium REEB67]
RGQEYFKLQNAKQAVQDYTDAIVADDNNAVLYYHRAKAYQQLGNDGAALTDINHAISFDPNQGNFYLMRAFMENKEGKAVLAHQDIQRAQFANPLLPKNIQFSPLDKNADRYIQDTNLQDVHDASRPDTTEKPQY